MRNVVVLIFPPVKFWIYGCTPVCVNGALDKGVLQFEVAFMDAVVEMVFENEKETSEVWARLAGRLEDAIRALLQTTQPLLPPPDNPALSPPTSAIALPPPAAKPVPYVMDDDDEQLAMYDPMVGIGDTPTTESLPLSRVQEPAPLSLPSPHSSEQGGSPRRPESLEASLSKSSDTPHAPPSPPGAPELSTLPRPPPPPLPPRRSPDDRPAGSPCPKTKRRGNDANRKQPKATTAEKSRLAMGSKAT